MRTGAGRRIFLNLLLSDIVLLPEFRNTLRIFPEIEMCVESSGPKRRKLNGKIDYTVGFGKDVHIFDNTPPCELHVVVIEAKNSSMDGDDLWQCVAETATLYKSRKMQKKQSAVCGVCFQMLQIGSLSILMMMETFGEASNMLWNFVLMMKSRSSLSIACYTLL